MQVLVVLVSAVLGCAQGAAIGAPTQMIRTPQFDSAVIESTRFGGNFAYKTMESHAYAVVNPIIEHVPTPVGVSYHEKPVFGQVTYHEPAEATVIAPAPVAVPAYPAAPVAPAYPVAPVAPVYPAAPAAPVYPAAPAAPVAPAYPAAPVAPAYPVAPAAPVADYPAPAAPVAPAYPAAPAADYPGSAGSAPAYPGAPAADYPGPAGSAPAYPGAPAADYPGPAGSAPAYPGGAPSGPMPASDSSDDTVTIESA